MEKKFMKYLLLGVFTFVLGIAFVGCGEDYDDDISSLNNKTATLQSAITALETAKTDLQNQINAVKGDAAAEAVLQAKAAAVQAVADALKDLDVKAGDYTLTEVGTIIGQLQALNLDERITGLEALLEGLEGDEGSAGAIIEHARKIAALELQIAALEGYAEGETVKADIEALKALIASGGELTEEQLAQIVEQLKANGLESLVTLEQVSTLITGVSLVSSNPTLTFNATPSLVDYVFGDGYNGAATFSKAGVQEGVTTSSVIIRVTPASAIVDKNSIKLINSKGSTDINEYVKVYNNVEPYNGGVITKASTTGLYEVTFTLGENYDAQKVNGLIKSGGKNTAFAIAIENKTEGESRYVTTDFNAGINTIITTNSVYGLTFHVKDKPIEGINNRYSDKELKWSYTNPANNTNPSNSSATTPDKADDDRTNQSPLVVEVGEEFSVDLTGLGAGVYAYYVDFDLANASTAEASRWSSADISGVKQVYVYSKAPKASIKINEKTLVGTNIGFRVYAINYDGTLVDPDGKAFYVSCAAESIKGGTLEFVYTVTTNIGDNVDISAPFELPNGLNILNVASYTLYVDGVTINGVRENVDKSSGIGLRNDNGGIVFSWEEAKKLVLTNVQLQTLEDSGKAHTGKLTFLNASKQTLAVFDVRVSKVLPTRFPITGLQFQPTFDSGRITEQLTNDNDWDLDGDNGYDFKWFFNTSTTIYNGVKGQLRVKLDHPTDQDKNRIVQPERKYRISGIVGNTLYQNVTYTATVGYSYGNISSNTDHQYIVWSDYISTIRFSTSLDAARYIWNTTTGGRYSWENAGKQITYNKSVNPIIISSPGNRYLDDIQIIAGSNSPINLSNNPSGPMEAYYKGIDGSSDSRLRFVDNNGNYVEAQVEVKNGNEVSIATSLIGNEVSPGPGVLTAPSKATFRPVNAILYLKIKSKIPDNDGVQWLEKIIEFTPTVVE
ncbi:hypothetical protein EZS27_026277 [termite gut metagenome]|uniref:Uncharacterized protein n=1 Tax=termite gut metagenome TaxID=433724 RepID=A0A5J4QUC7_9ZZZZ